MPELVCECGTTTDGYTNRSADGGEWWVHVPCGKPTAAWWRSHDEGTSALLNLFKGGPMDGNAYETAVLLTHSALALPLDQYQWSEETVTSKITGKKARVWLHVSQTGEAQGPPAVEEQKESDDMAERNRAAGPITERRKALKLSREDLATAAGVGLSQLYKLEHGSNVKPGTAEAVEAALARAEGTSAEAPAGN